jgi:hypothetical protein
MRRVEYPHHTTEQVRGYLEEACAIVAGLELDDDLRVPAFTKAVELLAAKQIVMEQIGGVVPTMAIPRGG